MIARRTVALVTGWLARVANGAENAEEDLAAAFAAEVEERLDVPPDERNAYALSLRGALEASGIHDIRPQHFLLVDRSPVVQVGFIYGLRPSGEVALVGAFRVATRLPGSYDDFATPHGVYAHGPSHPDFRAQAVRPGRASSGTGASGQRVFDFHWIDTPHDASEPPAVVHLRMHAADPERLAGLVGPSASKGGIRIPAAVTEFLDRRGILDADYEREARAGRAPEVLRPDREPTRYPGRYLVVVDSERRSRPRWTR